MERLEIVANVTGIALAASAQGDTEIKYTKLLYKLNCQPQFNTYTPITKTNGNNASTNVTYFGSRRCNVVAVFVKLL